MTTELFLQGFFGNSNKIRYENVLADQGLSFLRSSILRLNSAPREFAIFPFVFDNKKRTLWCGIAFSEEQSSEMRSLLNYFVGNSYSNLNRQSIINPQTPVGAVIEQFTDLKYCTK